MIKIRDITITNPFVLAPMAGVNCTSFRLLCKEAGAGLIYTQMYHSDFICHKAKNEGIQSVYDFINILKEERPVSVQLVGHDKNSMGKAAGIISKIADIIDINFGCCDPNIIKSGAGAYFTNHIQEIGPIVKAVIENTQRPVTAKIRIGWDSQSINGVRVAQMLEEYGVDAVAVHGRVTVQKYAGKANWQIIRQIKEKLSIPVIGNGDIRNKKDATDMLEQTGCDMAMIGRRAMGDPEIFTRCLGRHQKKECKLIGTDAVFKNFMDYYKRYDSNKSITELKTHALWFAKRARLGPKKRNSLAKAKDLKDIRTIFFSKQ